MRRIALCAALAVAAIAPNVRAYDRALTVPGVVIVDGKRPRRGNYEARLRERFSK
jgi:copper homeostasis protein CutC